MTAKPTSTLDVEVILSEKLGGIRTLQKYVEVYEEKGGTNALIKPKGAMPHPIFSTIFRAVKEMGGFYKRRENLWIVPLNKNKH